MTVDYGRALEFGISVVPEAAALEGMRAAVRAADRSGLDLVGIQDHPYQRRFLDTFAPIGTLLAETERVRVFPDVASLPLRPPATLAKQAASLDVLSAGRFELGHGAGAFWEAIEAMGGPRRTPAEAVQALEEAIAIVRQAWGQERPVRLDGRHYRVAGYHPGPPPAHEIEIWIGALRPRMLRLIGRLADDWLPSVGSYLRPEAPPTMHRVIDEAATKAGRDPAEVRRMVNRTDPDLNPARPGTGPAPAATAGGESWTARTPQSPSGGTAWPSGRCLTALRPARGRGRWCSGPARLAARAGCWSTRPSRALPRGS